MNKDILKKYLTEEEIRIFEEAKGRTERETYLFNKINTKNWFYPLKMLGYFKPENMPGLKKTKRGFQTNEWSILPYLEKISCELKDKEYIDERLSIVKNVTEYHIKNDNYVDGYNIKTTDNNHTWWYFIKILNNLPNENINTSVLKYIKDWIKSETDNFLLTSEITKKLIPKFLYDNSSVKNISKFEYILNKLLQLKKTPKPRKFSKFFDRYQYKFIAEHYEIEELLKDEKFIKNVGEKASNNFYRFLTENIKKLLFKEDILLEFHDNSLRFDIKNKKTKAHIKVGRPLEKTTKDTKFDRIFGNQRKPKTKSITECTIE